MTFKDTGTPRTDPELIRAIIRANHHGATIVSLAAKHGISTGTISHWIARSRNSGWVWPTPDDIVAWKIKNPARVKNRQYRNRSSLGFHRPVDRTGTQRRLQALYAIGHDWQSLGHHLEVTKQAVRDLANRRGVKMRNTTARRIEALYDELCMVVPTGYAATRAKKRAALYGWVPPLAWDNIDDPAEVPTGHGPDRGNYRREELLSEFDLLVTAGTLPEDAAARLGVNIRTIERHRAVAA